METEWYSMARLYERVLKQWLQLEVMELFMRCLSLVLYGMNSHLSHDHNLFLSEIDYMYELRASLL